MIDPTAAAQFYENSLELSPWSAAQDLDLPGVGSMWRAANAGIRLLIDKGTGLSPVRLPVCEAGITHICVQTTDANKTHMAFAGAGAGFHCEPIDLGTGFLYSYARDVDVNVIEIEGVAPVWTGVKPWLAHVNLATADFAGLLAFYAALLGTHAVSSPRLRDDPRLDAIADLPSADLRMGWVQAGNMQIEVMQYYNPPTTVATRRRNAGACGYRYIAFQVGNLMEATKHLIRCGGTLEAVDPSGLYATCKDPDQNELVLVQPNQHGMHGASIADLPDPDITQSFATAREAYLQNV